MNREPDPIPRDVIEQIQAKITWTDMSEDVEVLAAVLVQIVGDATPGSRGAFLLHTLGEALYKAEGLQPRSQP